jgi:YVTN family beta-propeller protein
LYIGGDSTDVIVVDTATRSIVTTIPTPTRGIWDIGFSPSGHRVYVSGTDSQTISVIDAASNSVVSTFSGITNTGHFAVDALTGLGYAARPAPYGDLARIDFNAGTITSIMPLSSTGGLTRIHQGTRRLYASTGAGIQVVDLDSGSLVALLPQPCSGGVDMAFSRGGTLLYRACATGMGIVDTVAGTVKAVVNTGTYAYRVSVTQ